MANGDTQLRDLIRLIPPARALQQSLEESLHAGQWSASGPAVKLYEGLHKTVAGITSDPYLDTLALNIPAGATDEEKVAYVHLAAGQLVAFIEGQTGLVGLGSGGGRSIHLAPKVSFNGPMGNLASETLLKILSEAKEDTEEEQEA